MKRFIFVLLAVLTAFTFTACSKVKKIDLSLLSFYTERDYLRPVHAIIVPEVDIDELVIECEAFDADGNILDTLTLEFGRVKKNKRYKVLITGTSATFNIANVSDMEISDAWGIIKK